MNHIDSPRLKSILPAIPRRVRDIGLTLGLLALVTGCANVNLGQRAQGATKAHAHDHEGHSHEGHSHEHSATSAAEAATESSNEIASLASDASGEPKEGWEVVGSETRTTTSTGTTLSMAALDGREKAARRLAELQAAGIVEGGPSQDTAAFSGEPAWEMGDVLDPIPPISNSGWESTAITESTDIVSGVSEYKTETLSETMAQVGSATKEIDTIRFEPSTGIESGESDLIVIEPRVPAAVDAGPMTLPGIELSTPAAEPLLLPLDSGVSAPPAFDPTGSTEAAPRVRVTPTEVTPVEVDEPTPLPTPSPEIIPAAPAPLPAPVPLPAPSLEPAPAPTPEPAPEPLALPAPDPVSPSAGVGPSPSGMSQDEIVSRLTSVLNGYEREVSGFRSQATSTSNPAQLSTEFSKSFSNFSDEWYSLSGDMKTLPLDAMSDYSKRFNGLKNDSFNLLRELKK